MQQVDAQPTLTYLPTATYDDLVKRANLADLLADKINAQAEDISCLKREIKSLQDNQEILFGLVAKRKGSKEQTDPKILDCLYKEMIAIGRKQVDFATAAKMVKRSKSRLLQLKAEIGQDMRFILVPSESHSQKVLIRLRQ